jgi:hypothetical protein
MKVRWTQESLRLRITPPELDALMRGEPVRIALTVPGGLSWRVALLPTPEMTRLTCGDDELRFYLAFADCERLALPSTEGVYFKTETDPSLRYFVEKDFPCAHPRLVDALEAQPETFASTPEFEARKNVSV